MLPNKFISPLGNTVVPPDYLYGSSLLPDGQLTLVLDGATLAKRYRSAGEPQQANFPQKAHPDGR